jgi:hypothetical protein
MRTVSWLMVGAKASSAYGSGGRINGRPVRAAAVETSALRTAAESPKARRAGKTIAVAARAAMRRELALRIPSS